MSPEKYQIIFATGNQGKIREIKAIIEENRARPDCGQKDGVLSGCGQKDGVPSDCGQKNGTLSDCGQQDGAGNQQPEIEVLSMKEAGVEADPEETGQSFEDNALIKAKAVYDLLLSRPAPAGTMRIVMSDDSGLVIDALDGAPGIYSARYMGYDTDYRLRMEHILELMKEIPEQKRTARFVAAVAAVLPDGSSKVVRGAMEGRIGHSIAGENGFGYDPFFYLPEYGKTSAEISPEEKNRISHRGKALRKMLTLLDLYRDADA